VTDPDRLACAVGDAVRADPLVAWRVCVLDPATGRVIAHQDPDTVQRSASLGKLLLLVEVARRFEDGSLDPAEPLAHGDDDWVEDSGLWWHLSARALPAVDCAALVGAFSDNLATNVLLRRVGGPEPVARSAAELGVTGVGLHRYVGQGSRPGPPPHPHGLSGGSATGYASLMARLHRGDVASPEVSARVLGWLSLNADLSMVGGALGLDPLCHDEPDRGLQLWNKTGTISDVRGDVGVVDGPARGVAYAVLTEWDDARHPDGRDAALNGMNRIGQAIRSWVEEG
jgi:beta-lactamase class A